MKKKSPSAWEFGILLFCFSSLVALRTSFAQTGAWTEKRSFGLAAPEARGGVSFTINNKAFVQVGTELWEFDPVANIWTQKADYPAEVSPLSILAFAVNGRGYISSDKELLEYNPLSNQWSQKANFPGPSRV